MGRGGEGEGGTGCLSLVVDAIAWVAIRQRLGELARRRLTRPSQGLVPGSVHNGLVWGSELKVAFGLRVGLGRKMARRRQHRGP